MVELTTHELSSVEGGISCKSILTGIALGMIHPLLGAGYWVGYYMNS